MKKKEAFVRFSMAFALAALVVLACAGCSSTEEDAKNSPFTHGNVQLNLQNNVTTQAEVIEKFGPPNIATIDASGNEIWTYQKNATVTKESSRGGYFTIIVLGGQAGSSGFEQSQRTMTLIIKFNKDKRVVDFKSMATSF